MENLKNKSIAKLQAEFNAMVKNKKPNEKGFFDLKCEDVKLMDKLEAVDALTPLTPVNSLHDKFSDDAIFNALFKLKANFFPEKFEVKGVGQKMLLKFALKSDKVIKEAKKYGKIENIKKYDWINELEKANALADLQCYHDSFQIAKYMIKKLNLSPKILVGTVTVSCPETFEDQVSRKISVMHAVVESDGKIFDYCYGIVAEKPAYERLLGFGQINEITADEVVATELAIDRIDRSLNPKSEYNNY